MSTGVNMREKSIGRRPMLKEGVALGNCMAKDKVSIFRPGQEFLCSGDKGLNWAPVHESSVKVNYIRIISLLGKYRLIIHCAVV